MQRFSGSNPVYSRGKVRVHFSVSRKVGIDDIRISISSYVDPHDERLELGRLQSECVASIQDYIDNQIPNVPAASAALTRGGERVSTQVTEFRCSFEEGIKKIKAVSSDFPKHGVIVFDETLAQIGLTKADISLEHGMKFNPPLQAIILMSEENKPRKVVSLKRAE